MAAAAAMLEISATLTHDSARGTLRKSVFWWYYSHTHTTDKILCQNDHLQKTINFNFSFLLYFLKQKTTSKSKKQVANKTRGTYKASLRLWWDISRYSSRDCATLRERTVQPSHPLEKTNILEITLLTSGEIERPFGHLCGWQTFTSAGFALSRCVSLLYKVSRLSLYIFLSNNYKNI